jgi:hypothetical protein
MRETCGSSATPSHPGVTRARSHRGPAPDPACDRARCDKSQCLSTDQPGEATRRLRILIAATRPNDSPILPDGTAEAEDRSKSARRHVRRNGSAQKVRNPRRQRGGCGNTPRFDRTARFPRSSTRGCPGPDKARRWSIGARSRFRAAAPRASELPRFDFSGSGSIMRHGTTSSNRTPHQEASGK